MKHGISLILLTWNEAERIRPALDCSHDLVDEIVVVDSHSTDDTLKILAEYGARVIQADFTGSWAALRNIALEAAEYDWRFVLDSDERLDDEIRGVLRGLIEMDGIDCFCFNRKNTLDGVLSHYPDYHHRLFRDYLRYSGELHEHLSGFKQPLKYMNVHVLHPKTMARQKEQTARYKRIENGEDTNNDVCTS